MRKIIALFLSVCMTVGFSTSVFAYSDVETGTVTSEAVELLSNLDILDGFEDGTYKPSQIVTRAEMAKIICEMLELTANTASTQVYNDVPITHWAAGYINTISAMGIICGYGNGNYGPEDTVTYEQAIKMVVCALGYEPMASSKGSYPSGYLAVASTINLLDNVKASNRGDIAILVYNALQTPVMEQTAFGSNDVYKPFDGSNGTEYRTLLTSRNIYIATGVVDTLVDNEKINFTITKDSDDKEFEQGDTPKFLINNSKIKDYIYQEVKVYVEEKRNEYSVIGIEETRTGEILTIISDDIKTLTNDTITYFVDAENSSKTKTITIDTKATVEFNKQKNVILENILLDANNKIKTDYEICLIENTGDKNFDAIIITQYTSTRVEMVDTKKDKILFSNGTTITFEFDNDDNEYILIDEDNNILTLSDFKENDVIGYIYDKSLEYVKIIKLSNSIINGMVDLVRDNSKTVVINGVEYKVDETLWSKIGKPGVEGTFYIGLTNKIIDFDGSSAVGKYGYIFASGTEGFDNDTVIKMLTNNGVEIYTLKNNVTLDSKMIGTLVEYKLNSKGLISSLETVITEDIDITNNTYNADTEMLNGKYINKDTSVFIINSKAEDSYITNYKYFIDEGTYNGKMFINDSKDVEIVVVTSSNMAYDNNSGFAIVTGTSITQNEDNNTLFAVTFVQNEEEHTIYFEDYSFNQGNKIFKIGTVFVYTANEKGYVKTSDYTIVTNITDELNFSNVDTTLDYGKDVKVVTGYIENTKRETSSKGEVITVNKKYYVITTNTNKYTYDSERNRYTIETEDFLSGNAYYGNKTPVMLKIVDGVVVDIYTISPKTK